MNLKSIFGTILCMEVAKGQIKEIGKTKKYFVTLYVPLSSLRTWKLSTKFYATYKSAIIIKRILLWKTKLKLMSTLTIPLH